MRCALISGGTNSSLKMNNFSLVSDEKNNVYLVKIKNIYENNLSNNSHEIRTFANQTNIKLRDNLHNSYDFLLNEKYKIKVIEDCAHAIESQYNDKHCGTFGIYGCFSFYATKNLVTAEGGMIITNRDKKVKKLKQLGFLWIQK